jgi:hypothetical protein
MGDSGLALRRRTPFLFSLELDRLKTIHSNILNCFVHSPVLGLL